MRSRVVMMVLIMGAATTTVATAQEVDVRPTGPEAGTAAAGVESPVSGTAVHAPEIPTSWQRMESRGVTVETDLGTRLGVEADSRDRLGHWLMVAGASLVAAGLGDYVVGSPDIGLSARGIAAYGSGLVLFSYGALRAPVRGSP